MARVEILYYFEKGGSNIYRDQHLWCLSAWMFINIFWKNLSKIKS